MTQNSPCPDGSAAVPLRHYLPYDCRDLQHYDDSALQMSQTPHDPTARYITSRGLEAVGRQDLDVAHFVHRQPDVLVAEFRQYDRPVVGGGTAGKARSEVNHRHDGPPQVDQPTHVGRRARKPSGAPEGDDLSNGADVAAIHRAGDREQQQSLRAYR